LQDEEELTLDVRDFSYANEKDSKLPLMQTKAPVNYSFADNLKLKNVTERSSKIKKESSLRAMVARPKPEVFKNKFHK